MSQIKDDIPVTSSTIISLPGTENRTDLCPRAQRDRITTIPGQQPQLIAWGPAVRCGKGQHSLASIVEGCRSFVNGSTQSFPRVGWVGYDLGCAKGSWGCQWGNTKTLFVICHAWKDKAIAVLSEAKNGCDNTPFTVQLAGVCACVPWYCTTCKISVSGSASKIRKKGCGRFLPMGTLMR